ncbi:hypothetical protein HMPREF9120_00945, partial [Neisseria sp. oral taxon 020 str. F0370]
VGYFLFCLTIQRKDAEQPARQPEGGGIPCGKTGGEGCNQSSKGGQRAVVGGGTQQVVGAGAAGKADAFDFVAPHRGKQEHGFLSSKRAADIQTA